MTEGSLFLLVPPAAHTRHMPNLGDRALHQGMTALLEHGHRGSRRYDSWNSFPGMTWRRLSASGAAATTRFDDWLRDYRERTGRPAPIRQKLARLLPGSSLAGIPLWRLVDGFARRRTGQTAWEAASPRLFPGLAARRFAGGIEESEAVIMNAGGLLADHLTRYLPGRVFALRAALEAGRPTAIVNYSFAITRPELLDWVAPVMRAVTLHLVRESESRERLLDLGVDPDRIVVSRDAAFAVAPLSCRAPSGAGPTVAIQVRGDRSQDLDAWAELVSALDRRFGARVVFLAGCLKHDPPVHRELRRRCRLAPGEDPTHADALRSAIGGAHALVTDRYHGVVFATQMGTPFVPLASTTHKTAGLVRDLGYPGHVHAPLTPEGSGAVVEDVGARLAGRQAESAMLQERASAFRAQVFTDYDDMLAQLLGTSGARGRDER